MAGGRDDARHDPNCRQLDREATAIRPRNVTERAKRRRTSPAAAAARRRRNDGTGWRRLTRITCAHRCLHTIGSTRRRRISGCNLDARCRAGVSASDLDSVCGGRGICGRCQVVPERSASSPSTASAADPSHLTPSSVRPSGDYHEKRARVGSQVRRLGCAAKILGDVLDRRPAGQPDASPGHPQVGADLHAVSSSTRWCTCVLRRRARQAGSSAATLQAICG